MEHSLLKLIIEPYPMISFGKLKWSRFFGVRLSAIPLIVLIYFVVSFRLITPELIKEHYKDQFLYYFIGRLTICNLVGLIWTIVSYYVFCLFRLQITLKKLIYLNIIVSSISFILFEFVLIFLIN